MPKGLRSICFLPHIAAIVVVVLFSNRQSSQIDIVEDRGEYQVVEVFADPFVDSTKSQFLCIQDIDIVIGMLLQKGQGTLIGRSGPSLTEQLSVPVRTSTISTGIAYRGLQGLIS